MEITSGTQDSALSNIETTIILNESKRKNVNDEKETLNENEEKEMNNEEEKKIMEPNIPLDVSSSTSKKVWRPARIEDCKTEHFSTPRRAKLCFDVAVRKVSQYRKQLDASRKRFTRLQLKVQTLKDLLSTLQKKQYQKMLLRCCWYILKINFIIDIFH